MHRNGSLPKYSISLQECRTYWGKHPKLASQGWTVWYDNAYSPIQWLIFDQSQSAVMGLTRGPASVRIRVEKSEKYIEEKSKQTGSCGERWLNTRSSLIYCLIFVDRGLKFGRHTLHLLRRRRNG